MHHFLFLTPLAFCILHFTPDVVKKARLERRRPDVPPEIFNNVVSTIEELKKFLEAAEIEIDNLSSSNRYQDDKITVLNKMESSRKRQVL